MFAKGMFSVDPNSTPEQLANRRALMAMLRPKYGSARYVGEGLGQLATGLVEGIQSRKMDKVETAGRSGATAMLDGLLGGSGAPQGPLTILGVDPGYGGASADPLDPTNIAGDTMAALGKDAGTAGYRQSLIGTESGGNWRAQNNETGAGGQRGHYGRVQFGRARLQEAMDAGAIPQGTTPEQFMASPALQIAAENWHFADLEKQLAPLVGTVVNGKPLDLGSLVAMGHLGGVAGARRYAETGGGYNPSDAFGTSLSEYASTHGGKSAPSTGLPQIPADQLLSAMSNPWLTPDQRATLAMMLENQVQAADPMRQIELEKAQLELDAMKSPQDPTPKAYAERIFMMQAAGIDPASPEGQRYLLTGALPEPEGPAKPYSTMGEIQADLKAGLITPEQAEIAVGNLSSGTSVTVNMGDGAPGLGKLSTDYGYVLDPTTGKPKIDPATGLPQAAPVPGSPAANALASEMDTRDNKASGAATASDIVTSATQRALGANDRRIFGGVFGALSAYNPSTQNAEVYRQVDVLKANAKVENLQAMRAESPTGGALGSVTEGETKMLADQAGALDPASPNFERDLLDYTRNLLRTIHGREAGDAIYSEQFGKPQDQPQGDWVVIDGVKIRVKQ